MIFMSFIFVIFVFVRMKLGLYNSEELTFPPAKDCAGDYFIHFFCSICKTCILDQNRTIYSRSREVMRIFLRRNCSFEWAFVWWRDWWLDTVVAYKQRQACNFSKSWLANGLCLERLDVNFLDFRFFFFGFPNFHVEHRSRLVSVNQANSINDSDWLAQTVYIYMSGLPFLI